ncbi:hypothetical protein BLS_007020 [Venturia inaequalis]|uniref:Tropomyosin n=1 Tax=Venturia inaequalis TaxID=5025 RepID=A0A8H3UBS6_VENIN|nr:hypothetical protein BLS_007020 [Venturia inaequalis]KAE9985188.1 hypothetical protein EG328_007728 [Venturia inaequalis]KAE9989471.1 hypothetical protein EG327_002663 [Venturia inaequalis]RDI87229.1 hypothetical protein Vi05172_g2954 [Venturia inaequalis]
MDAIKNKMSALRIEADESAALAEELKAKVKTLEQENLAKEQEITSLSHKNQLLEADVDKLETQLKDAKDAVDQGATHGSANESLTRRIQLLEEEAEQADRNLREINEKHRQTDVKAGHYERKVQALEQSNTQWETKYEEMAKKYAETKKELDDFVAEIGNI